MSDPLVSRPTPLLPALLERVESMGDAPMLTFLKRGTPDGPRSSRTAAQVHERAAAVAAHLRGLARPGDRALLLFPPGLDFVDAFFGCLYAGVVAVPAYPPDPVRLDRTLPRLEAIATDAGVSVVLTDGLVCSLRTALTDLPPVLADCPWVAVDAIETADEAQWPAFPEDDDLAFLQYTSGSTAAPRGVVLTHGNLATNIGMIVDVFDVGPGDVAVSWLPVFHDMGLIGMVLGSVVSGIHTYLMSPLDFLKRPLSWLQAMSTLGATHSGAPNFAYGLAARKATPEVLAELDLSRWRLAFNGAEPVDPEVLARFTEVFASTGFRNSAFFPTYGLAEATLMVSGGPPNTGPVVGRYAPNLLHQRIAEPDPNGAVLVASGLVPGDSVRIVADGAAQPPRRIGEIWVRGGHVARRYWTDAAGEGVFDQALTGHGGGWMRTGDEGFIDGERLFVTGRIKDLIIVNGRNIHPHDIERIAERAHPKARPGGFAAFGVPASDGEVVALAMETKLPEAEQAELIAAIRAAVSRRLQVHVADVLTVPHRALLKTSSGKIQRHRCRALYLELRGEVEQTPSRATTSTEVTGDASPAQPTSPVDTHRAATARSDGRLTEAEVFERVCTALLERTSLTRDQLLPDATPAELGVDSIALADLAGYLEDQFGRPVVVEGLVESTLSGIAAQVSVAGSDLPSDGIDARRALDLSHFQAKTGGDLFAVHDRFGQWFEEAYPSGYDLYDQALTTSPGARIGVDGVDGALINLASYNYLGLSTRPEVRRATIEAVERYGLSASGSPVLSGLLDVQTRFEQALARFKQIEAALLFPTGYSTNLGVISALVGPGDTVIADALAHASIVDGVGLARARMVYFEHNDMEDLERALKRSRGRTLVAVEGVYSMDGDLAPLPEIAALCRRHDARLLVDEAHSAFVFGEHGRGAVEHFGVEDAVDVHIGTLSKGLGGMGGYVGGSKRLIDYIRTYARARTFSCALSPAVLGGLLRALEIVDTEPELRARLWRNVRVISHALRARGVDIGDSASQVIPVLVNDDQRIFAITRDLIQRGVYLNPVLFPAVRKNHSRFRISVSAAHEPAELVRAADIIAEVLRAHGVIA